MVDDGTDYQPSVEYLKRVQAFTNNQPGWRFVTREHSSVGLVRSWVVKQAHGNFIYVHGRRQLGNARRGLSMAHRNLATAETVLAKELLSSQLPHGISLELLMGRQALTKQWEAASASPLASSFADFGIKQGWKNWYYHWRSSDSTSVVLHTEQREYTLNNRSQQKYVTPGLGDHCSVRVRTQHPCNSSDEPVSLIRIWRSNLDAIQSRGGIGNVVMVFVNALVVVVYSHRCCYRVMKWTSHDLSVGHSSTVPEVGSDCERGRACAPRC